ncbi:hypothetical protein D3C78_1837170 [compost metagenome]
MAFEQAHAQQAFDIGQRVSGRGLAHADVAGRLLDAAEVGDAGEQLQVPQPALDEQAGQQGGGGDVHERWFEVLKI